MRPEVRAFVAVGALPGRSADEEGFDWRVEQLEAITRPVTAAEAQASAACFGPDDCYGVAWAHRGMAKTQCARDVRFRILEQITQPGGVR